MSFADVGIPPRRWVLLLASFALIALNRQRHLGNVPRIPGLSFTLDFSCGLVLVFAPKKQKEKSLVSRA